MLRVREKKIRVNWRPIQQLTEFENGIRPVHENKQRTRRKVRRLATKNSRVELCSSLEGKLIVFDKKE